jgi:hypothetical protein
MIGSAVRTCLAEICIAARAHSYARLACVRDAELDWIDATQTEGGHHAA